MNKTARCLSRAAAATYAALLLMLCLASVAKGDNCSGPDDCRAAPGNIDAATGVAGGGAGIAIGWWIYRRRKEEECAGLRRQCEESRKAADEAEKAAKEARRKADEANKPCAEARKAREAAEKELAELDDSYLDKSWAESEGRRITRRDLKLKRDAAKEAHQRYRRGEITAQQLEQEWKRLETPEALDELRKKDGETRGERKAEAEKKLAEAKAKEEEACKAADPALEAQAKEAGRKAREARKKAEADCRAAAACAKELAATPAPAPKTPQPTPAPPEPDTDTEPETAPEPEEKRCAPYWEALANLRARLDMLFWQLRWFDGTIRDERAQVHSCEQEYRRAETVADEARRKVEEFGLASRLWSSFLNLFGVEGAARAAADAYAKAAEKLNAAGEALRKAADSLKAFTEIEARQEAGIRELEAKRQRAQDRVIRCLAGEWGGPVDEMGDTFATTLETNDDTGNMKIFGPRRGE